MVHPWVGFCWSTNLLMQKCNLKVPVFATGRVITTTGVPNSDFSTNTTRSGNGVRHINEVQLRRAWLVLELVTTSGGSTIQVYLSRPLRPTRPGHPSEGKCNEYRRWFWPSLGRNGASEVTTLWRFINQFINININ